MSERQGIEIDYCPDCRGVWLDRGELDKIIERSGIQGQPNYNAHNQMSDSRAYDHKHQDYYRHKKKSWLNELFD
jgi:Zn-finger nucleic acid-binding protein